MTDYLMHAAISNALMGSIWALVVLVLTQLIRNEHVAHALWMLVLVRFLFPPLVPLQFEIEARPASPSGVSSAAETRKTDDEAGTRTVPPSTASGPQNLAADSNTGAPAARVNAAERAFTSPSAASIIAAAWIAGSLVVFARLCLQAKRITRLVASAQPAPTSVAALANQVAADWGLRRRPLVCVIDASASPAVCWVGRVWVLVLPAPLIAQLTPPQLRSIISHEYAHLQRKDHWVRWLEAATLLVYWWNPLAWMACRRLRIAEELCCDGAALRARGESIESYSSALFAVVEMITNSPKTNSPLSLPFANSPFLKRRFEMILQNQYSRSPRFRVAMLLFAAALLPWFPTSSGRQEVVAAQAGGPSDQKNTTNDREAIDAHSKVSPGLQPSGDITDDNGMPATRAQLVEAEVTKVTDAWDRTRATCRAVRVKWNESSTYAEGSLDAEGSELAGSYYPAEDTTVSRECECTLYDKNIRWVREGNGWSSTKAEFMPGQMTNVFNGDVEKSLLSGEEYGDISWGFIRSRNMSAQETTLRPILWTYRAPSERLKPLSGESWTTKQGSVDDAKCLILEISRPGSVRSYWLDPQLNYAVRRYDVRTTSGVPLSSITTEFRSDSASRPIPSSWVITLYSSPPPGVDNTLSNTKVIQTIRGTVTETEFNFDYTAADFDIEFPPSSVVQDERDNSMSVITKTGEHRDVPPGASWKTAISSTPEFENGFDQEDDAK